MRIANLIPVSFALLMGGFSSISVHAQGLNNAVLTNVVSRASCPVSMSTPTRSGDTLHLKFTNSSGKTIRGILFGAAYYDAGHSAHVIQVLEDEHRVMTSGTVKTGDLNIRYWHKTKTTGWATWPSKILYSDGSKWQMSGRSRACVATYWRDGGSIQTMLASNIDFDDPVQVASGSPEDSPIQIASK